MGQCPGFGNPTALIPVRRAARDVIPGWKGTALSTEPEGPDSRSFPVTDKDAIMPTPQELEEKFWKALSSDRAMMLGLDGVEDGHVRPMTAQFEENRSPLWFFTAKDSALVQALSREKGHRAIATFTSKGHDLFASVRGDLKLDNDRVMIDRLWNPYVAAWYEGGKDDPTLALLRLV